MIFLFTFFEIYGLIMLRISPLVVFLILMIVGLGWRMAKLEGWSFSRGQYCAFITATTVGYGVVHPTMARTRLLSVIIAGTGLLLTGILVALAYQSLQLAALYTGLVDDIRVHFPELMQSASG